MGTKNNPGPHDCYANAEPDEPMFVLLARDEFAPMLVRDWVRRRQLRRMREARVTMTPAYDEKELEALSCARAMEQWKQENR